MINKRITIIIIIIIFFTELSASPVISSTAVKIMREIKIIYQTEKADRYIENYLKEKDLSPAQISDVRERINFFFNSQAFVETGAAYLTASFHENDLIDIFNSMRNGYIFETVRESSMPAMKKVQKLFAGLDPYLYLYLKKNIIPQPFSTR